MGEAKRRKAAGMSPKSSKKELKSNSLNLLANYPRLGLYLGAAFMVYLIYDVIHYYTRGWKYAFLTLRTLDVVGNKIFIQ